MNSETLLLIVNRLEINNCRETQKTDIVSAENSGRDMVRPRLALTICEQLLEEESEVIVDLIIGCN